jgi:hypothetical protein
MALFHQFQVQLKRVQGRIQHFELELPMDRQNSHIPLAPKQKWLLKESICRFPVKNNYHLKINKQIIQIKNDKDYQVYENFNMKKHKS